MAIRQQPSPSLESRSYQALKGEKQHVQLADRSHVTLASASEVASHFTPRVRTVTLQRGEAYFEVRHEASRPFVVRAGDMTVTAVGTKFDVRTSAGRTVVAVTEGAVDVTANDVAGAASRAAAGSSGGDGGGKRDRTADLLHAMQALSQLSYTPEESNRSCKPSRRSASPEV